MSAIDPNRPSLAFEYEVALALVSTSVTLSFTETPYPTLNGSFETIDTFRNIELVAPSTQFKSIPCGYNPSAQVIPAIGSLGHLSFEILDRAKLNTMATYLGKQCVARIIAKVDEEVARTVYCSYFNPRIRTTVGVGDDVGKVSIYGEFSLIS